MTLLINNSLNALKSVFPIYVLVRRSTQFNCKTLYSHLTHEMNVIFMENLRIFHLIEQYLCVFIMYETFI